MTIQSIAVGSVPNALASRFRSGELLASDIPTRLQPTDTGVSLSMFSEFAALADGTCTESASPDDALVRKAQLIGPITLLRTETETLQTSIRRIRAALDTLLDHHPLLDELWFDEPMLGDAPNDWVRLLGHTIRAIKSEYLDLRIGVHSCGPLRGVDLPSVDADSWAFDLHAYGTQILALWQQQKPAAELVWSVVPTDGSVLNESLAEQILRDHATFQPNHPLRISTSCGLGTRDANTVERVLANQATLVEKLRRLSNDDA